MRPVTVASVGAPERSGNLERDRQRGLLHLDYAYFVVSNHIE